MIIYKTTNLINRKYYIGFDSKDRCITDYPGSGLLLKRAINKHGIHNFKKTVLEHVTKDNWGTREVYWISKFDSTNKSIGYNIAVGGAGGDTLSNHPNLDELRKKFSHNKNKGRPMPKAEHSARWIQLDDAEIIRLYTEESLSQTAIGKNFGVSKIKIKSILEKHDIQLRTKIESCSIRKKPSDETRKKMSNAKLGSKNSMYGKNYYDCWVVKYGKTIADEKMLAYKQNMKIIKNKKNEQEN